MKAAFTYALRFSAEAVCMSPLRTGAANGDSILMTPDGFPFVQGTTLAGALRSWKNDDSLFGTGDHESSVVFSDLIFEKTDPITRPRLRIDRRTGAAADGAKFESIALPSGTRGSFSLVWCGRKEEAQTAQRKLTEYLGAIHSGSIVLGAETSNGFGRLSLKVTMRRYDLAVPSDLAAWLEERDGGVSVDLPAVLGNETVMRVCGVTGGMLVSSGVADGVGSDSVKLPQLKENGQWIVPGSSIKGVLRSRMEWIAESMGIPGIVEEMLGIEAVTPEDCLPGRLRFSDGHFDRDTRSAVRKRIRIDRITGGVMNGALFSEESLGGSLRWEIRIPGKKPAFCALVLYALRDLGIGQFSIGAGSAGGQGTMEALTVEIESPEGSAKLCCRDSGVTLEDRRGITKEWRDALKEAAR